MPAAIIEVRRAYSREEEVQLIEAVHAAMMEGLKIPEWDKNVRLVVHEPHRFTSPPDKGDRYTLISIDLFEGRSIEAKRALYKAVVERLEVLHIPRDHVKVLLRETARENWGVRGGVPASEVDLGFEVNV
jgi:phenylpyruvate tautomerase PptA (4-oxalocrotonate tautomerase family)